ncbi:MAG TPA: AAA family ATPase [Verrucomicrobiae bacterium]
MPSFEFITVTRVIGEDIFLAEAAGTPELSGIGADADSAQRVLRTKLKAFFSDEDLAEALTLFRRRVTSAVQTSEVDVKISAPGRTRAWEDPVIVPVHYVWWQEREDLFVAFSPWLRVTVFAPRAEELGRRMEKNARLVIARWRGMTLIDLSWTEAITSLEIGTATADVARKTPKQLAASEDQAKDATETLKKVAEGIGGADESAVAVAFEMEPELDALAEALRPDTARSVLLVGPHGSGKSAMVREFVRRKSEFQYGATTFWETSGSRLMTGPIGFGMWQERCQNMCAELAKTNGVLHIGNLAELTEVGKTRRTEQSVGGFLRPWIARGEVQFIAEITPEQLAKVEQQEPQLVAAFHQIRIPPRSQEQTLRILEAIWKEADGERPKPAEERTTLLAISRLQSLHDRYSVYSPRPGRAVRFLRNLLSDVFPKKIFSEEDVTRRFSRESGMPAVLLDDNVPLDLAQTEEWLRNRVIGQNEAVRRLVDLIAIVKARVARPGKPLASLLFIGPTGVGKTELAKALAEFFFGSTSRMTRFDLNQFADALSVQRLIGGIGTGEGLLTARVREQPFSVILLDEFEKADGGFFDLLLQILGEGRLTDASGRLADFSNCVIVMTSNLGAERLQRGTPGFKASGSDATEHFESAVAQFLRPEIFNRIDAIVPFQSLPADVIRGIAEKYIAAVRHRHGIAQREIELRIEDGIVEHLAKVGLDPKYGARPLKRAIERELLVPLALEMAEISGQGATISAGIRNRKITAWSKSPPQHSRAIEEGEKSVTRISADAVEARRAIVRVKSSPAFVALENQITILGDLESRMKRAKWKSPEDQARVTRLPILKRVPEAILQLEQRTLELETTLLSTLYQKQDFARNEWSKELAKIRAERRELQLRLYEASHEKSDEVIIAIYGEDKSLLFQFLSVYRNLAEATGKILKLQALLPANRGKNTKSVFSYQREEVEEMKKFFAEPPENLLGAVMKLSGHLYLPKFSDEAGVHRMVSENLKRLVLVETASGKIEEYQPPRGFELQGFITGKTAELRRTYFDADSRVEDSILGQRPWIGPGLERCVSTLLEENLTRKILATTGGE